MGICFYYFGIKNDAAVNMPNTTGIFKCPLGQIPGVAQQGQRGLSCDSQIALPGQAPPGWVRSASQPFHGECRRCGQPRCPGRWPIPQPSEGQEERWQPESGHVLCATPSTWSLLVHAFRGKEWACCEEEALGSGPWTGELAEPHFPGCIISKSACRAGRRIENTLTHNATTRAS